MKAEWFKDRLRELRQAAGLSRKGLAEKAALKESVIRDLEQGLNAPRWPTVIALCQALGVGCDAFLQPPSPDLPPAAPGRPRKATGAAESQAGAEDAGEAEKAVTNGGKGHASPGKPRRKKGA